MARLTRTPETLDRLRSVYDSIAYATMMDELAARPTAELRRALKAIDPNRSGISRMTNWTMAIHLADIAQGDDLTPEAKSSSDRSGTFTSSRDCSDLPYGFRPQHAEHVYAWRDMKVTERRRAQFVA